MAYPTLPVMQFGMFGGGSGPGELFSLAAEAAVAEAAVAVASAEAAEAAEARAAAETAVARGASVGAKVERMKGIG